MRQGDATIKIDTARYAAVIALDSVAARYTSQILSYVRSGGGLIAAGDGASVIGLAPILPAIATQPGLPGDFTVQVYHRPRYVNPELCINCDECSRVCPIDLPSGYQAGLVTHKAVYKAAVRAIHANLDALEETNGEVVPGSLGRLVPGYEARIVGPDGNDVPDGEAGTLWIKGESAAILYWQAHDKSKEVLRGDWVVTGDHMRRDAKGYFWYEGRTDDMLKVGGRWVSPVEVESTLIKHPAVLEAAVVAHRATSDILRRSPLGQPHLTSYDVPAWRHGNVTDVDELVVIYHNWDEIRKLMWDYVSIVRTGKRLWIFHTIPQPGEFGADTWPDAANNLSGGANAWAGVTVDEKNAMVFAATGSASFDFYGVNRHGDNLFANCVLALDARSGRRIWHFQAVRHDIWDWDFPAAPNLVTVTRGGKPVEAVAQITKTGYVFVFNRRTGEPLFPIEYRKVPASDVDGEKSADTQPVPLEPPPFTRQRFSEEMLTRRTPEAHAAVLAEYRRLRSGDIFTPVSLQGTIIFPGVDGGGEWGGAAFDPESALFYVNSNEMPWIIQLEPNNDTAVYKNRCATCHGDVASRDVLRREVELFVGAVLRELARVRDRRSRLEVAAAVGEGVGRDVDHAHDERARQRQQEAAAAQPGRGGGSARSLHHLGSGAGVPVGAGALGPLSRGLGTTFGEGFGGRGGRPCMMSSIWSASIVSHSSSALAIASTLSRFSSSRRRARRYCVSMMRRISPSTFCMVASETFLCVVIERPRKISLSFSP